MTLRDPLFDNESYPTLEHLLYEHHKLCSPLDVIVADIRQEFPEVIVDHHGQECIFYMDGSLLNLSGKIFEQHISGKTCISYEIAYRSKKYIVADGPDSDYS